MRKKRNNTIALLLFALGFTITFNISQFYIGNYNGNTNRNQTTDPISDKYVINHLKTSANEPNGKPLLIHQHTTISNTFFPPTLPSNVSFTLLEGWTSKNVTINYEGVSHRKDWVINGSFDTSESPWEYFTNNTDFVQNPWQTYEGEECVGITINKGQSFLKGEYSYFEENFTISEISVSNTLASLSMDYFLSPQGFDPSNDISAFVSIDIGGNKINTSGFLYDLVEGFWTEMSITYDLSNYGQQLPENITLRVGLTVESDIGATPPSKNQEIYFDNIEFEVWTEPNEPNLIIAEDLEFSSEYSYQNITNGMGKTFIDVERSKTELSDIKFTISKNNTFTEELKVYNITIISEAVKIFNSSIDLQDGSLYNSNTNIEWQIECLFDFLPFTYTNNWVEIKKPSDWNITSVLDGYTTERRASCTGKEPGSENLQIPKGVFAPGLWKIKAVSQNYLSEGSLIVWNGTTYNEESRVMWGDTFQINVTLNNTVTYANTNVSCTIEYPNGTLYWQGNKELSSYNLKFGNFTVGSNMSVGDYQVIVEWTNNNTYLSRDQVGFAEFGFKIWHQTNLTAVDSDFERIIGGPLLIKVKFFDIDINMAVQFASVKYNSTFGASGVMIYLGSGVYFIDIDTSSLSLGDYYFSFNSTLEFYENQTAINLIHLKIIAQPLALEGPSGAINAMANNYAICQINVTGAISGTLLPGNANMTTDWDNPYQITNDTFGTFTLNFSTIDLPTSGYLESYNIEIFANKTNYGNTNAFITLLVHPISTEATVNISLTSINSNEVVNLKVNYTIEGSNELILGSNCTVTWQGSSLISPVSDGFNIKLFTIGMQVDYYTALIKLEKVGFEDAFESVTIIIIEQDVNLTVTINSEGITANELIESYFQQTVNISARVYAVIDEQFLSGGMVTLLSNNFEKNLTEIPSTYFSTSLILDGINFISGINNIFLRFEQANYTTKIFTFQLFISAQNVNLTTKINYQEIHEDYLLERSFNQEIRISCRAFAEIESVYLSGGNLTFINGEYEVELFENGDYWFNRTILISTSSFSIGPNYAYLRFQQNNYTTTIFTFQVFVNQIEINIETPDFEGFISGIPGEIVLIRLNLTETGSTNHIENATVYYSWNFGLGYFDDKGSGIYELEVTLPTEFEGSYDFKLIISKEGIIYKTKEFTFFIDIKQVEAPNFIIWIVVFILIAISGILGILSLRSYVILPKRREKEAELISKIQVFRDVIDIRAAILIHKNSGLPLFSDEISAMDSTQDATLISGFVQAITAFSETMIQKEFSESRKLATDYEYLRTIIDLDFKFFQLLVCDYDTIRILIILKSAASERLKKQLYLLAVAINSKFGDKFRAFTGVVGHIQEELQDLFNQFLFLHYSKTFEISLNKKYLNSILESGELTRMEIRLVNVIKSISKNNKLFTVKEAVDLIEEKNEDLVLEAMNSLILRRIITSTYSSHLHQKKGNFKNLNV